MAEKAALLRECKKICYKWRMDKLDCSVSFARQRIDCTFEDALGYLNEKAFFVVIDRGTWGSFDDREHFEIAFRSMGSIDYFLFIEVESEKMPPILDKYNLFAFNRHHMLY